MRESELLYQRKLAEQRESYISKYFTKVRMVFAGNLVLKARDVIVTFLKRFDPADGRHHRPFRLVGTFHPVTGLAVAPTRSDFKALINDSVRDLRNAFLLDDKQLKLDVVTDIMPQFSFDFTALSETFDRFTEVEAAMHTVMVTIDNAYNFFQEDLPVHAQFLQTISNSVENMIQISDLRDMAKVESTLNYLLKVRSDLQKRPRQVWHNIHWKKEVRADFVVDMRQAWEASSKVLEDSMVILRNRMLNELNNALFNELQEKWTLQKDKNWSKADCVEMEAQLLLYAMMALAMINVWPEVVAECKAGLDTVMTMYQGLAEKTTFTHRDAAVRFNKAAQAFGVQEVRLRPEEEEDDYDYSDES
jgi:hypothetical protein